MLHGVVIGREMAMCVLVAGSSGCSEGGCGPWISLSSHMMGMIQHGPKTQPLVALPLARLLRREVCNRGGYGMGNGINWKGQVFPRMRNYTAQHKMTGVGNALKRHYQMFLLEYEHVSVPLCAT